MFFLGLFELPAAVVLGIWFVTQFFTNPNEGIAWLAHVGGFTAGALLALRAAQRAPTVTRSARGRIGRRSLDTGFGGGYPGRR